MTSMMATLRPIRMLASLVLLLVLTHRSYSQNSSIVEYAFGDIVKGGTSLLSGSLITDTDVDNQAALALDVRDIMENLQSGDLENGYSIYMNGRNSNYLSGNKRSLADLGSEASSTRPSAEGSNDPGGLEYLKLDPTFAFHMYGLGNLAQRDADVILPAEAILEHLDYAHKFVLQSLSEFDENDPMLPVEAMVSLNVWGYAVHKLWLAVDLCRKTTALFKNRVPGDNAQSPHETGEDGMSLIKLELKTHQLAVKMAFDEAMAVWIGSEQDNGDAAGYMMYARAQKMGNTFTTADPEAKVNSVLKQHYQEGRAQLTMEDACTNPDTTEKHLYTTVTEMTQHMMIPQIQSLIHALKSNDAGRVKLYATAVVPQIAACRWSSFRYLKQELLDTNKFNSEHTSRILQTLQENYDCLGFYCGDVGPYLGSSVNLCRDTPVQPVLAGYSTISNVRQQARIDLDVVQMQILITLEAHDMALLLYRFGRNARHTLRPEGSALHRIAISVVRANVKPWFQEFVDYFDDQRYADSAVEDSLTGVSKWSVRSTPQRVQAVVKTIVHQAVYLYVLALGQLAYDECRDDTQHYSLAYTWDLIAAYSIGSVEGDSPGHADVGDGRLLWNQANRHCAQFATCNDEGIARSNARLMDLLYAGRAESERGDCSNLKYTIGQIERTLLVPTLQGILKYAVLNERRSDTSQNGDLAAGEILALSVLPFLHYYSPEAARVLERNMIVRAGVKPVRDGRVAVAQSLVPIVEAMDIPCEDVGKNGDVHLCWGDISAGLCHGGGVVWTKLVSMAIVIVGFVWFS